MKLRRFLEVIPRELLGAYIIFLIIGHDSYLETVILYLLVRIIDRLIHWAGKSMVKSIEEFIEEVMKND